MKRIFVFFFALLLPIIACAEIALPDRVPAEFRSLTEKLAAVHSCRVGTLGVVAYNAISVPDEKGATKNLLVFATFEGGGPKVFYVRVGVKNDIDLYDSWKTFYKDVYGWKEVDNTEAMNRLQFRHHHPYEEVSALQMMGSIATVTDVLPEMVYYNCIGRF